MAAMLKKMFVFGRAVNAKRVLPKWLKGAVGVNEHCPLSDRPSIGCVPSALSKTLNRTLLVQLILH
jgi:hypothetical protein